MKIVFCKSGRQEYNVSYTAEVVVVLRSVNGMPLKFRCDEPITRERRIRRSVSIDRAAELQSYN